MLLPAPAANAQAGTIPVNIESTPPGATVFLDSATGQNLGVTPLRRVRITRGAHTLIFRLPRHRDASVSVNVVRRNETFRGVLDPLGEITIAAANDSATGATVRIDGQPVGAVPMQQMVEPGRHLIQIDREGYVTFTQWVQVGGAQQLALPVILERQAPSTGSVLVAADISGAAIYIDGDPRGSTPTVVDNVTAGVHQIEVRAEGFQTQSQQVEIRAGERARVEVQLRPDVPPGGTLVVVTQPRGASVVLDGEALGAGPVTREGITPGEHILEVSMTGFQPISQPVTIEAGQRRAVNIVLQEVVLAPGSIIVRSSTPGAVVLIDGEERGAPPIVVESATAGTHAVVVRAPGFEEYRTTCTVGPGRNCEVDANLGAEPVRVIVRSNIPGSALYIDGEQIGPVPYEGTVPSGNRRLEVRAPGYDPHVAQVMLTPGSEPRLFDVALIEEGAMSDEERARLERERLENYAGQTSFAANVIPT
ncbi:MAG: PEGA domain-containing protein, partial [Deltaproteobacteria bacterium]|nr:PEGA domain-containing protein [Deltaproteobacteria bacterium]